MNRGWRLGQPDQFVITDPRTGLQFFAPLAADNSSRVAIGDIDSDGDPDIIISQLEGHTDSDIGVGGA